jgi:hypothetical protein
MFLRNVGSLRTTERYNPVGRTLQYVRNLMPHLTNAINSTSSSAHFSVGTGRGIYDSLLGVSCFCFGKFWD